ncbi:MAG: hypothetical protein M3137_14945 [Actinomycetota bacterium]|nr:hypothetical protein [Actinomycetota bacterium]
MCDPLFRSRRRHHHGHHVRGHCVHRSFDRFDVYYFQRLLIPTSIAIFVFVLLISRLLLAVVVMAALVVAVVVILIVFMVAAMTPDRPRHSTDRYGVSPRISESMTSSGGT